MAAVGGNNLPDPISLSHHLSKSARNRNASNIKQFYRYFSIPGIGQLAGGLPHPNYFPYDTLEAESASSGRWNSITNESREPSNRIVVPKFSAEADPRNRIDLATALQYGTAQGYPPLFEFVRNFTRNCLHPNFCYNGGPEVVLTCGATDGFSKAIQALSNEWFAESDPIAQRQGLLVEEYCYMNAIQTAKPRGLNIVPVAIDEQGMVATGKGGLQDVLANWDTSKGKRPHLIYTVSVGQNPTSGTVSLERRRDIYDICVKYDVLIIEDDPYYCLQYPLADDASRTKPAGWKSSGFDFLDSLVPSYLSVDYQGRVIRLDTFSKTIAPGCRLGWITAQPMLIERILRITETSTQQPSGFVQSMVAELIMGPDKKKGSNSNKGNKGWETEGWVRWLEGLRGKYQRRMEIMCDILDNGNKVVKMGRRKSFTLFMDSLMQKCDEDDDEWAVVETTPIYSFIRPAGGMFIWLRFDFTTHPLRKTVSLPRLSKALWVLWTRKPYLVLVAPGSMFAATEEIMANDSYNCFRVCFAACDDTEVAKLSQRLVEGAHAFWRIRSSDAIDDLLKDEEGVMNGPDNLGIASLTGIC